MARKQLIALAAFVTLVAAGTAARADDITMANESFVSTKTRAEVQAELLQARAEGTAAIGEIDLSPTMVAKQASGVSRDQVRAGVGEAARKATMLWYPA